VWVRVPATSANLGPGFDALGLALGLYDEVTARVAPSGITVTVSGEGAGELPADETHLVVRCMLATFDRLGGRPAGLAVECVNAIPQARGLGSSSAAIVAGILAARALVEDGDRLLPAPAVLDLANEIEGHPDNVAPCLLGGFTIAWLESAEAPKPASAAEPASAPEPAAASAGAAQPASAGDPAGANEPAGRNGPAGTAGPGSATGHGSAGAEVVGAATVARAVSLTPAAQVQPVVFIPEERGLTAHARAALPATVPHGDAARNAGRAALLVHALTADPRLLLVATEDRLHQGYRAPGMPATAALVEQLRAAGIPAVVSGAGPTVLAFGDPAALASPPGWRVLAPGIDTGGALVGVDSKHAERDAVAAGRVS
jgi:homoserine kinase